MSKQTAESTVRTSVETSLPLLLGRAVRHAVFGLMVAATAMPLLARAENSIKAVSGSVQGGAEVIRLQLPVT